MLALLRLRQEEAAQTNGRQLPTLLTELAELRRQLHSLWNELVVSAPEYVALRRGEPLAWKEIQAVFKR